MTTATRDAMVADYLRRLEAALHDLPAARRREIVDGIRDHIQAARANRPDEATPTSSTSWTGSAL